MASTPATRAPAQLGKRPLPTSPVLVRRSLVRFLASKRQIKEKWLHVHIDFCPQFTEGEGGRRGMSRSERLDRRVAGKGGEVGGRREGDHQSLRPLLFLFLFSFSPRASILAVSLFLPISLCPSRFPFSLSFLPSALFLRRILFDSLTSHNRRLSPFSVSLSFFRSSSRFAALLFLSASFALLASLRFLSPVLVVSSVCLVSSFLSFHPFLRVYPPPH